MICLMATDDFHLKLMLANKLRQKGDMLILSKLLQASSDCWKYAILLEVDFAILGGEKDTGH